MQDGSKKAIVAAFLANAAIAVAKLVGFFLTGAASMLAEAVHSSADAGNQGLLFLGGARARKTATPEHPFGYGRERYFWAFVVAVVPVLLVVSLSLPASAVALGGGLGGNLSPRLAELAKPSLRSAPPAEQAARLSVARKVRRCIASLRLRLDCEGRQGCRGCRDDRGKGSSPRHP